MDLLSHVSHPWRAEDFFQPRALLEEIHLCDGKGNLLFTFIQWLRKTLLRS